MTSRVFVKGPNPESKSPKTTSDPPSKEVSKHLRVQYTANTVVTSHDYPNGTPQLDPRQLVHVDSENFFGDYQVEIY